MKKILEFFIEPFKVISRRSISENVSKYFNRHKVLYALVSLAIAVLIVLFMYSGGI